ncbi:MAG: phage holin family protein [Methylobacterium frigidaeris]
MSDTPHESTPRLILRAIREASRLATMQIALFRIEAGRIARIASLVGGCAGAVVILACVSGFLLLVAAVKFLAWLLGSEILASILGAAPFALAAIGLTVWGLRMMSLKPRGIPQPGPR